jgi:hypothetical protein
MNKKRIILQSYYKRTFYVYVAKLHKTHQFRPHPEEIDGADPRGRGLLLLKEKYTTLF